MSEARSHSPPVDKLGHHLASPTTSDLTSSAADFGTWSGRKEEGNLVSEDDGRRIFGSSNPTSSTRSEPETVKSKMLLEVGKGQAHDAELPDRRARGGNNPRSRHAKVLKTAEPVPELERRMRQCRKRSDDCVRRTGAGSGKGAEFAHGAEGAGKLEGSGRTAPQSSAVGADSKQGRRQRRSCDKSALFKCQFCEKVFSAQDELSSHLLLHTGKCQLNNKGPGQVFSCDICGKSYTMRKSLTEHRRSHTQERPYRCPVCGKTYAKSGKFAQHKRTHTGEKRYKCSLCGKQFMYRENLTRHWRIHTGERPFCCWDCGQRFTLKSSLNRHRRTHTGERPYLCDLCGKQFAHKETLSSHQRVHSGEKPFTCHVCHRAFSERGHLKYHCNRHIRSEKLNL